MTERSRSVRLNIYEEENNKRQPPELFSTLLSITHMKEDTSKNQRHSSTKVHMTLAYLRQGSRGKCIACRHEQRVSQDILNYCIITESSLLQHQLQKQLISHVGLTLVTSEFFRQMHFHLLLFALTLKLKTT